MQLWKQIFFYILGRSRNFYNKTRKLCKEIPGVNGENIWIDVLRVIFKQKYAVRTQMYNQLVNH